MPTLIIEQISWPSFEFLDSIYMPHAETIFADDIKLPVLITQETFDDCIPDDRLDFYTWLVTYFLPPKYDGIYELCLLNHIKITEAIRWNSGITETCIESEVDDLASSQDVVRYSEWLADIGRAGLLSGRALGSLIWRLATDQAPTTAKRLLYTLGTMDYDEYEECIEYLIDVEIDELLVETGVLRTKSGLKMVTDPEHPKRQALHSLWLRSTDGGLVARSLSLICDHISTPERAVRIMSMVEGVDQYRMLNLRFLLGQGVFQGKSPTHDKFPLYVAAEIILWSIVVTTDTDPSLILELSSMVFEMGTGRMMAEYHKRVMAFPELQAIHLKGANYAFTSLTRHTGRRRNERAVLIIETLGPHVDLRVLGKQRRHILDAKVDHAALLQIKQRDSEELRTLGDLLLSYHVNIGDFLSEFREYIGPQTIRQLLRTVEDEDLEDSMIKLVLDYAKKNLRLCVEIFVQCFIEKTAGQLVFQRLPEMKTLTRNRNMIRLTDFGYELSENGELCYLNFALQIPVFCYTCPKSLTGTLYKKDGENHGIFYCTECRDPTSTRRVECQICLSDDESLDMLSLSCKHTYCRECLITLLRSGAPCPTCRVPIACTKSHRTISKEDMINQFFETH